MKEDYPVHTLLFKLTSIPDITLPKYQYLDAGNVNDVLQKQAEHLRILQIILKLRDVSMHLVYTYQPSQPMGQKLNVYLMFRSGSAESLKMLGGLLPGMAISQYFRFTECSARQEFGNTVYNGAATLIKREMCSSFIRQKTGVEFLFYTVPGWEPNDSARMVDMMQMLQNIGEFTKQACAIRIDLYAVDAAVKYGEMMRPYLKQIAELQYGDENIHLSSEAQVKDRMDESMRNVQRTYEKWISALTEKPHFRFNMYAFAFDHTFAATILGAAGAEAVKSGGFDILPVQVDGNCGMHLRLEEGPRVYNRVENGIPLCRKARSESLNDWSTLATIEEISPFFRLPSLFDGEHLDIKKESAPPETSDGLPLGYDQAGMEVFYPYSLLNKHALIAGVPGSGKTNTMLHIISQLQKGAHPIPFLVFESAKQEYRALFNDKTMNNVFLFSPGVSAQFPLAANPFAFPEGVVLCEHISMLMDAFAGSFYLQESARGYLDRAVENAYAKYGWTIDKRNDGTLPYPVLADVYELMEKEISGTRMSAEQKGNFKAFLEVRLRGMMRRDAGELFASSTCTIKPEEWIRTSAIVELERLDNETKNFFILLLLTWIRETLRKDPNADRDKYPDVRHIIFIEEAHNLIASTTEQRGTEEVNPKVSATAFIVKMLAEVRALREGIVIADQLPSLLSPEVIKNTSLKVLHRMTAQDDRELMGSTMSASGAQLTDVSTYRTGHTLVFYESLLRPFNVRIHQWTFPGATDDSRYIPMESSALLKHLLSSPIGYKQKVLAPYTLRFVKSMYEAISSEVEQYANDPDKYGDNGLVTLQNKLTEFKNQVNSGQLQKDAPDVYKQLTEQIRAWRVSLINISSQRRSEQ